MLKRWILACIGSLTLAAPAVAAPATGEGPSFSCTNARTSVERTICATPDLAAADRKMAELFALAQVSAFGTGPSNQLAAQREALREMRACATPAGGKDVRACLRSAYARRNAALAVSVLMTAPDIALPVLRQLDPGAAPVLEATAVWANRRADADWAGPQQAADRAKIARLLQPYVTALLRDEDQSFGRSILTDPIPDGIAVRSVDDLFRSDRHFAAFLNVLGPYLPELPAGSLLSNDRRILPCAAIVRHPALLGATGPVFGSTMDNFVLDTDCDQSLPPTPMLDALAGKLRASWPECDGTIRFSAYRHFDTALQQARLGRTPSTAQTAPRRAGTTTADAQAARVELASYYRSYLGKPAAPAEAMARNAIAAVMTDAHECGA